jgi:hypothetical protein
MMRPKNMKAVEGYRLIMPDKLTSRPSNLMSVPNARNSLPKVARIFHPARAAMQTTSCDFGSPLEGVLREVFRGAYASRRVLIRRPARFGSGDVSIGDL